MNYSQTETQGVDVKIEHAGLEGKVRQSPAETISEQDRPGVQETAQLARKLRPKLQEILEKFKDLKKDDPDYSKQLQFIHKFENKYNLIKHFFTKLAEKYSTNEALRSFFHDLRYFNIDQFYDSDKGTQTKALEYADRHSTILRGVFMGKSQADILKAQYDHYRSIENPEISEMGISNFESNLQRCIYAIDALLYKSSETQESERSATLFLDELKDYLQLYLNNKNYPGILQLQIDEKSIDPDLRISFPVYLISTLFDNIMSNTAKAYKRKPVDDEVLDISISADSEKQRVRIIFSDNAGGFDQEMLMEQPEYRPNNLDDFEQDAMDLILVDRDRISEFGGYKDSKGAVVAESHGVGLSAKAEELEDSGARVQFGTRYEASADGSKHPVGATVIVDLPIRLNELTAQTT